MFGHGTPHRFGTLERLWESTLLPLLEATDALSAAEIGSDKGDLSRLLTAYCGERGGKAHVIDPSPAYHPERMKWELGDAFVFHKAPSLEVLESLPPVDAVLIDGDHNWHTVTRELEILAKRAASAAAFPLVILHDTGWPYGRRDMYHVPERIPAEHRHPHDRLGMRPDRSHLAYGGLNAGFCNARHEGGERNGVLTAVEDFLKAAPYPMSLLHLPGVHGIAILVSEDRLRAAPKLAALLERLRPSDALERHIEAVESDRLRLEMRVQQLEAALDPVREESKRLRMASEPLKRTIETLTAERERLLEDSRLLQRLQRTRSWKITAPLRTLERLLRGR